MSTIDPISAASALALSDLAAPAAPPASADPTPPAAAADTAAPTAPAESAPADASESVETAASGTEPAAVSSDAPVDSTPAETPAAPPTTTDAPVVWKLKRNGQVVELTDAEEVRRLAEQGYDYTQKTQKVSARERELNALQERILAERQAEQARMREFLGNKEIVRAYLDELEAATPASASPQGNPNEELVTVAQAQALAQRAAVEAATRLQAEERARMTQAVEAARLKSQTESYQKQLNETIAGVVKAHPELGDIDGISRLLLDDIAPTVIARIQEAPNVEVPFEEVAALLTEKAAARAAKEQARLKRYADMALVRAAKEKPKVQPAPPGGSAPAVSATPPRPLKLGSRELTQSVTAELEAAFRAKK